MESKRILAFDFGASSGRAMIATLNNGKLNLNEIHRFSNDPVTVAGRLCWDVLRLFHEIKQGITKAVLSGGFDCIGIDTWGVDFGLIDKDGELISNPLNYRDTCTQGMDEEVFKHISKEELYNIAGTQFMQFNTIYQLMYLKAKKPELLSISKKALLIPDLFAYLLTGEMRTEYSNASTTNLLNASTRKMDEKIFSAIGVSSDLFAPMIKAGEAYGYLKDEICEELHCNKVPVIAVATHDTASAVASVPTDKKDYAYISCGTWSLFGTVIDEPILSNESYKASFTNEGAFDGKIRYLKNIMGLWLIQQSRNEWKRQGLDVSFDEMEKAAMTAEPFKCFIDPDAQDFVLPGNMPKRVSEYCRRTGQFVPTTMGEILRCIYESLAMKYKYAINILEEITDKKFEVIHMIGGGIKDNLLCGMTASACGKTVKAGPVEATVTGNALIQMVTSGQINNMDEGRKIVFNSFPIKEYSATNKNAWNEHFDEFISILKK